jgi:hypothetical protein
MMSSVKGSMVVEPLMLLRKSVLGRSARKESGGSRIADG